MVMQNKVKVEMMDGW